MNLRKVLPLLLVCILCISLLAACGDKTPSQVDPTSGEDGSPALTTGLIVLNAEAALEISYDEEGLVLSVDGLDENGITLSDRYTNYTGKACADAVRDLVSLSVEAGFLTPESDAIVIKQSLGAHLPSDSFLKSLMAEADALSEGVPVFLITEEELTTDGYINLEAAKTLVANYLSLEESSDITGDPTPVQGLYALSLPSSVQVEFYTVDANTGSVVPGYPGGSAGDYILDIDPNGAMYDPNDPFLFPDETEESIPEETLDEYVPETDYVEVEDETVS